MCGVWVIRMIGVDEVVALFVGDESSMGYAHPELVVELCCRSAKSTMPTYDWAASLLYPARLKTDIPPEIRNIIQDGVKLWYKRGRFRYNVKP
jgi:hypothetical protein